jgi:hypothetical protein
MPQQIRKFASGICAVNCAVIVHDQRPVAVVDFQGVDLQAAVRTTAHAVVAISWHRQNAALRRRVVELRGILASVALLRRVGSACCLR